MPVPTLDLFLSEDGKTLQLERGRGPHPPERSAAWPRCDINTASEARQLRCGEPVQQLSPHVSYR